MTDWELLVPGIGLTVLGMAGVGISLAGIAKTFLEGMHAVSALMMFIGMIILAAGILKDGLPRSNQAKAAALIIVGFMATFGAFALGLAGSPVLVTLTGILFLILIPAIVIAWAAHHKSPHFKAITILFSSASVVGVIAFSVFGAIAPQPIEAGVTEKPETQEPEITEPILEEKRSEMMETKIVEVEIVVGAEKKDNPEFYVPAEVTVESGTTVVWKNSDTTGHTVTSGAVDNPDTWGQVFDSGFPLMQTNEKFEFTFVEKGEYPYFCQVHPWMVGKVIAT